MKRLVWGIIVAVFGLLCFASAGENPQGPAGSITAGILCVAGGGVLIFFGTRYLMQKKTVSEIALQMLRQNGKVEANEIARRVGTSEVNVREHIATSQLKGIIPFDADVV